VAATSEPPTDVPEPATTPRAGVDWSGLPSPELLRAGIALLLGALASTFGAFLLGEYQFDGTMPVVAGALFGLVVAELVVEVGRRRTRPIGLIAGLECAGGLLWAGWISAGEGLEPISGGAWLAAVIALVVASVRIGGLGRRRSSAVED
jgi:hypothetical protein